MVFWRPGPSTERGAVKAGLLDGQAGGSPGGTWVWLPSLPYTVPEDLQGGTKVAGRSMDGNNLPQGTVCFSTN